MTLDTALKSEKMSIYVIDHEQAIWVIKMTTSRAARQAVTLVEMRPSRRGQKFTVQPCREVCCTADRPRLAPFSVGSQTDLTRHGEEVIQCQERFPFLPPLTALCHSTPHQLARDALLHWPVMHALRQGKTSWIFYLKMFQHFLLQNYQDSFFNDSFYTRRIWYHHYVNSIERLLSQH